MNYNRFDTTSLFLAATVGETITSVYFFTANNTAGIPQDLSLEASWSTYLGFYIFLSVPIQSADQATIQAIATALAANADIQDPGHTGAIWLDNTGTTYTYTTLNTSAVEENVTVSSGLFLGFGKYRLPIMEQAPVLFNVENAEIRIGYPVSSGGTNAAPNQGIRISVQGDACGIAKTEAVISDFSNTIETGWSVGFQYFTNYEGGLSQFYPMVDGKPGDYIMFSMMWDILHPLDPERTNLSFTGLSFKVVQKEGDGNGFAIEANETPNVIPTFWRTLYGKPLSLRPVLSGDSPAQLVFQTCADASGNVGYYLSFKGDFELCSENEGAKQLRMLCGLAGTECLAFTAGDLISGGDILTFHPGQGAYTAAYPTLSDAQGFAMPRPNNLAATDGILNTTYTTAWVAIRPNTGNPPILYSVSPEKAGLYESASNPGLLQSFYSETARFTEAAFQQGNCIFPMVPYAGITQETPGSFSPQDLLPFELQIIGGERKKKISEMPVQLQQVVTDEIQALTTTPQGLLASIKGLEWQEVILAKNTELAQNFSFVGLPTELRNAFQTNQLFMVVSDAAKLGTFQNAVSIEGWKFNVNVPIRNEGQDQDQENILLLKFRKGRILDLIQDVNTWTDALSFNHSPDQVTSTQTWLINYCNDAIALAGQNASYAQFASLIQDPNWYGVIALKVDIDLGNFPKDLKGLLGAMDLSQFKAHHVGVQVNFIQQSITSGLEAPELSIKKSNLFGLVSYIDAAYQQSLGSDAQQVQAAAPGDPSMNEVDYAYKVLNLQIVFVNSAITDFNSKLLLTARKWFDEAASLNVPQQKEPQDGGDTVAPANFAMLFNGHYENHDGHKTYTFLTDKGQFYQYFIDSKVLNYIDFVKAQFATVSAVSTQGSTIETVTSAFTFYGYLNFRSMDGFDFFSYGSEAGAELVSNQGLYFSNLALDLDFQLDTAQNSTSGLKFNFSTGRAAYDPSMSTLREASLAKAFPLRPSAILAGKGDNAPTKLGYIHVNPPETYLAEKLSPTWFGLDFEILWGGPGALADQAGFIPHLLMAWSPGSGISTELLIRLPGSGGSSTLSLQSVLQLKIDTFRFSITEQNGQISYNLILNNIALSLLGLKLPPVGNANLMLLGDPKQPGSMGWYGAYINK